MNGGDSGTLGVAPMLRTALSLRQFNLFYFNRISQRGLFFGRVGAVPMACRTFKARDQTCATAVTRATEVNNWILNLLSHQGIPPWSFFILVTGIVVNWGRRQNCQFYM